MRAENTVQSNAFQHVQSCRNTFPDKNNGDHQLMIPASALFTVPPCVLPMGVISLGGLQGVNLLFFALVLSLLNMSCQGASPRDPLQLGLAIGIAKQTCGIFDRAITSLTFLYYGIAFPSVVRTAVFPHEHALRPHL